MFHKCLFVLALILMSPALYCAELPAYPFVTASGKAEVWLAPDVGEIKFELVSQAFLSEEASAALARQSDEVMAHLLAQGVAAADIESFELRKKTQEVNRGDKSQPAPVAYVMGRFFHVTVRELANWNAIIEPLASRNEVESFAVEFGRSDVDAVRRKLQGEAAQDARTQAGQLASAFGRRLGEVSAISQNPLHKIGIPFGLAAGDSRASNEPSLPRPARTQLRTIPNVQPYWEAVYAMFKLK
jgi:hypothetical protein